MSSSLLLAIAGLPDTKFKSSIDTTLAHGECNTMEKPIHRMSCYLTKALGNVGAEVTRSILTAPKPQED
ncbi:Transaldolase [Hordeum vulgare]|nr:Transaldolase [Hordeum vulgare]